MMNNTINLTDLYDVNELAEMTMEEIQDVIHDIYGYYDNIKKDAFIAYMEALSESKES